MIDSDVTGNFINKQQANSYGFPLRKKIELYALYALDGGTIGSNEKQVIFKIKILIIKILKGYTEDIQFNIIIIGTHSVVLSALWLQLYNPQID